MSEHKNEWLGKTDDEFLRHITPTTELECELALRLSDAIEQIEDYVEREAAILGLLRSPNSLNQTLALVDAIEHAPRATFGVES
jgi:hypothetical protein